MSVLMTSTIIGLQAAQFRNERRIAMMYQSEAPGRAAQFAAIALQREAIAITPVDTGAWRSSHLILEDFARGRAQVYVNPYARNPRSDVRVIEYAQRWEEDGGIRAVYQRTIREQGPRILQLAAELANREIMGT